MRLHWVSWEQHGDAENDPDSRPVDWPPPAEVLAFWETGWGGGTGASAYCAVVALVRAPSSNAAAKIVQTAWANGFGKWRFNREYVADGPPNGRFPPPKWSIAMGRWPWKKVEA